MPVPGGRAVARRGLARATVARGAVARGAVARGSRAVGHRRDCRKRRHNDRRVEPPLVGRTIRLKTGATASIVRRLAPLPSEPGARLSWFLEGAFGVDDKPDLYVTA